MGKRDKSAPRDVETEVRELLAGKRAPDVRRLLALIHEVNPTGSERRDARERYVLKARLQSLLVRHFRDELVVERDARDGVAGLRHRTSPIDACHTIVAELDDDARSWVQFQLDTAAGPGDAAAADDGPRSSRQRSPSTSAARARTGEHELLTLARRQLDAYELLEAKETLQRAVDDDVPGAAIELLRLLVDQLADDAGALALADAGDVDVDDAESAILLALAAARAPGEAQRARSLLQRLTPGVPGTARGAEVHVLLARDAIARADVDGAVAHVAGARALDPAHGELVVLDGELQELQRRTLAPRESEMQRAWSAGDVETAEALATALARESAAARQLLQQIKRRRDDERARELLGRARQALDEGKLESAARAMDAARALGVVDGALDRALAEARQVRRERAAADVVDALAQDALDAALQAYVALDPAAKAIVRARPAKHDALDWVEQALAGGAAPAAALKAVVALAGAVAAVDEGRVDEALKALEAHARVLTAVPRAQALRVDIERERNARRDVETTAALAAAAAALARDDVAEAKRLLAPLGKGAKVQELRGEVLRRERAAGDRERLEGLLAEGRFIDALDALAGVVAAPEQQARWSAVVDDGVRGVLRVRACVIDGGGGEPDAWLPALLALLDAHEELHAWLDDDGALLLPCAAGAWLFVVVYDVQERRCREVVRVQPPVPMEFVSMHVSGGRVVIASVSAVLVLERPSWRVAAWRPFAPLAGDDVIVDNCNLAPGGSHAWIATREPDDHTTITRILDIARGSQRRLHDVDHVVAVPGLDVPVVAVLSFDAGAGRLHEPQGPVIDELNVGNRRLHAVAAAPDAAPASRDALVCVVARDAFDELDDDDDDDDDDGDGDGGGDGDGDDVHADDAADDDVQLLSLVSDGGRWRVAQRLPFAGVYTLQDQWLATSFACARTFYAFSADDHDDDDSERQQQQLACLRAAGGGAGVAVDYRVDVPLGTRLVQDARSRRVLAVAPTAEARIQVVELGATPPQLAPAPDLDRVRAPLQPPFPCGSGRDLNDDRHRQARAHLLALFAQHGLWDEWPDAERVPRLAGVVKDMPVPELVAFLDAVMQRGGADTADVVATVAQRALAERPRDVTLALDCAERACRRREPAWDEVQRPLSDVDAQELDALAPQQARHALHLLGVAAYHAGDKAAARGAWQRGLSFPGRCRLDVCMTLVEEAADRPDTWGPDKPAAVQVAGAVATADACLERGDHAGAVHALRRAAVLHYGDVQSLARLAEAELALGSRGEVDDFGKVLALAKFVEEATDEHRSLSSSPSPGPARYTEEQIAALVRRARARLDEA